MKLSELKTGEKGIIVKVLGHGGFRKRIIEMGFIRGKEVEVLLNAPLQDPVKYKLMGYEVSLRHQEAEMIEVVSQAEKDAHPQDWQSDPLLNENRHKEDFLQHIALKERRVINVALVGNPNCGKTSLFNYASGAHGHVGNYSGVTVDASEAKASYFGYEFNLIDLPGTYSLSCYSPEELYVREHLTEKMPDIVINVIDASNLERNLYLTTQLVDMNIRMVCALNMYDEFERRGDIVDIGILSSLLGIPMVPTSFKNGMGVKELFRTIIQVYEGTSKYSRHLHINYGHEIENGISHIQKYLKTDEHITQHYSTRYLALKLLEHDSHVLDYLGNHMAGENRMEDFHDLTNARDRASARVKEETGDDSETAIMDAKYGFINGALKEAKYKTGTKEDTYRTTHLIDSVLSNRYAGFPIFFLLLFLMFDTTFVLGQYPMDWIEAGVGWLSDFIGASMPDGPLKAMLVDGIVGGVGAVIVFLPQILILYFFISLMEDSGYMARSAFIVDKLMHRIGLHGKSFIPMVMGFGCNVPAIMATRTIESRKSRLITIALVPFMSCAGRLPIFVLLCGAFFAKGAALALLCIYLLGILLAIVTALLFSKFVKDDDLPFVMELPPYRIPTGKAIWRHTWEKGKQYLQKMATTILIASVVIWCLGYFPRSNDPATQQENSYIGQIGKAVAPVMAPMDFDWRLDVGLLTGVAAKELVVSSLGVMYAGEPAETMDENDTQLQAALAASVSFPSAIAFMIFVLLYFPCIATFVAIKNETGKWSWAIGICAYTIVVAWLTAFIGFHIAALLV